MKQFLFIIFLFVGIILNAQPGKFRRSDPKSGYTKNHSNFNKRQKLENLKIKYLIDSISMTSIEAESFWSVYNEYVKSVNEIRAKKNENEIKFEEDIFNERKSFFKKLTAVFKSEEKANRVLRLDREFMKSLLKRKKNKREVKRPK
ncbi:MAG: hypothetical protein EBX50_00885 [Chitinophagia bacterium]|nr:hypothetical protein [Chitinophagia bacterium]